MLDTQHRDNGVVVLTFDDPARRNAMTEQLGDALASATAQLRGDSDVRVVVLTGTPPAFSAGGDLDFLEDLATRARDGGFDATETMRTFYERFLSLRDLPVPVIAAVNGHAVGAGLCVALACDLRVVADEAKVGLNFSRLGLHPGMGATWLLPRIVSQQHAAQLLYTGELIDGAAAHRIGLALESHPAERVLERALEIADQIAAASPTVVRQVKRTLSLTERLDLTGALRVEASSQAVSYASADLAEGLAAARERRDPDFS